MFVFMERFSKFKIQDRLLSEKAYHTIKSLIIDSNLKPGEKILQNKMAVQLGISKIPLIQALTSLNNEGLLEKFPRKGFYVKKFSSREIGDVFDVRIVLEKMSVSILAKNVTSIVIKDLKNFLKEFQQYCINKNSKKYHEVDVRFHQYLIESSRNDLLKSIFENFNILLICYTKGSVLDFDESYNQHKEIINAILEKNVSEAESKIVEHIISIKEKINFINHIL